MTWGYDVDINKAFAAASGATVFQHAKDLISDLANIRQNPRFKKPIIFIAHSLGGIVVKDAVFFAKNHPNFTKEVFAAIEGVIFLGTPHHGSPVASLGKLAYEISRIFLQNPNIGVLRTLESKSEVLERISEQFNMMLAQHSLKLHSFHEELPYYGIMIVPPAFASIGGLNETRGSLYANHRSMARFSSPNEINFQRVTSVLIQWVNEIIIRSTDLEENTFKTEYDACLQSLDIEDARSRLRGVKDAYSGTYRWIFHKETGFTDFLSGKQNSPVFWIQGLPGSGKSTAMKFALKHETVLESLQYYSPQSWVIASYFFHDRGTKKIQKSIEGFLQEVLYQVLRTGKHLFPYVYPVYSNLGFSTSVSATENVWQSHQLLMALSLIATRSQPGFNLCLFVDALDEHDGSHTDLLSVFKQLDELTANPNFLLRIVAASRPENIFKDRLGDCAGFMIHQFTSQDIQKYTESRLLDESNMPLTEAGNMKLDSLRDKIIARARGIFLWVRLVMDEIIIGLYEGDSIDEMEESLDDIPTELEDLYRRAITKNRRTSSAKTRQIKLEMYIIFRIITDSPTLLSPLQLLSASSFFATANEDSYLQLEYMSPRQLESRLYSRSAGLVETQNNYVGFVHQTVKEFIMGERAASVVIQDVPRSLQTSGLDMLLRFISTLTGRYENTSMTRSSDLDSVMYVGATYLFPEPYEIDFLVFRSLISIAQELESREAKSAHAYLNPYLSKLSTEIHFNIINHYIDSSSCSKNAPFLLDRHDSVELQQILLYCLFGLQLSLKERFKGLTQNYNLSSSEWTKVFRAAFLNTSFEAETDNISLEAQQTALLILLVANHTDFNFAKPDYGRVEFVVETFLTDRQYVLDPKLQQEMIKQWIQLKKKFSAHFLKIGEAGNSEL
jgi:PGAP1-like protein